MLRDLPRRVGNRTPRAAGLQDCTEVVMEFARIEARLCTGALLVLTAGVGVYALARGAHPLLPGFAAWSGPLPTLLHTAAFVLLSLAVCAPWPRLAPVVCAGWVLLEAAFELLQLDAVAHMPALQALGRAEPLVRAYLNGRFDPFDILAAVCGALVAAAVFAHVRRASLPGSDS
jgi:hypothetical protein